MSWFLVWLFWSNTTAWNDPSPVVSVIRMPMATEAECLKAMSSVSYPSPSDVHGWNYGSGAATVCVKAGELPVIERLRVIGPPAAPSDAGVAAQ